MTGFETLLVASVCALLGGAVGARLAVRRCADAPLEHGFDVFTRELERARRYERPLTLVRVPDAAVAAPGDAESLAAAIEVMRSRLRTIDALWRTEEATVMLLPECRRGDGEALVRRIAGEIPYLVTTAVRLAEFPVDGVTSGALLSNLADQIDLVPAETELPALAERRRQEKFAS